MPQYTPVIPVLLREALRLAGKQAYPLREFQVQSETASEGDKRQWLRRPLTLASGLHLHSQSCKLTQANTHRRVPPPSPHDWAHSGNWHLHIYKQQIARLGQGQPGQAHPMHREHSKESLRNKNFVKVTLIAAVFGSFLKVILRSDIWEAQWLQQRGSMGKPGKGQERS